jgi:CspA family cold shock protein
VVQCDQGLRLYPQPDGGGGKDVFVQISAVEKAGMDGLPEGAKITYDIISDRGKESAGS